MNDEFTARQRAIALRLGGRPVPLTLRPGGALSHPPGQGGLSLTRVVLSLSAPVSGASTT